MRITARSSSLSLMCVTFSAFWLRPCSIFLKHFLLKVGNRIWRETWRQNFGGFPSQKTHRTTGCFDDRLLTMMTDTGFYVPCRVGYNFRLAKL